MRSALSLALLPPQSHMRSGALFSHPELALELQREEPALVIEEDGVRFELEFRSREHLTAFVGRVGRLDLQPPDAAESPPSDER